MEEETRKKETAREKAQDLLSRMTLREKVGQLQQRLLGFTVCTKEDDGTLVLSEKFRQEVENWSGLGALYGLLRSDPWSGRTAENGLSGKDAIRAANLVQDYVMTHGRLHIPVLFSTECPHGHQALDGRLLPVSLAMGATFDPALVEAAFRSVGKQLHALGIHLALVSVLDVARDPRWGRCEESFSEDPYLASRLAASVVRGIQKEGVGAVAKHFAAQGAAMGGVNGGSAAIGRRELFEIHLPPCRAVCNAGAMGIMAAYNDIDGTYCCASSWLLRDVLRSEFGFDGIVMADGFALDNLTPMTGAPEKSAALALHSGITMSLWDHAFTTLEEACQMGLVREREIDEAVLPVLMLKEELGLFEHPFVPEDTPEQVYMGTDFPESLALAEESMILLENRNQTLPFHAGRIRHLALIGPAVTDRYAMMGDYTPPVRPEDAVTIADGVKKEADAAGFSLEILPGCSLLGEGTDPESDTMLEQAREAASRADTVILVLGGSSSRYQAASFDRNGAVSSVGTSMDCGEGVDRSDIALPPCQRRLAAEVLAEAHRNHHRAAVIVMGGRPYAPGILKSEADALLYAFYPGPQGGEALRKILFGEVNPSGRLPVSIPRSSGQIPVCYNQRSSFQAMHYSDLEDGPAYAFGEGKSYTAFSMHDITLSMREADEAYLAHHPILLSFTLRNEGSMEGTAVPICFLRLRNGQIPERVRECRQFDRIFLKSGEERRCSLALDFSSFEEPRADGTLVLPEEEVTVFLEESGQVHFKGTVHIHGSGQLT